MKRKTTKDFIEESIIIHSNKYDYSLVKYKNNKTKVKIICPIHGMFEQIASKHLIGRGCPKCANNNLCTTEEFIEKSKQIHTKYDYSLVDYKNNKTKVKIICPTHGIFVQTPTSHLSGNGCPYCSKNKKMNTESYINRANKIHNNKYDYSLLEYVNMHKKVKIICPTHGVFEQSPQNHIKGVGCSLCSNKNMRLKTIKRIVDNQNNGYQISPNFNKNACNLFDKISEEKNIHIQHAMNGGEYYIKELGYWLDGYDKENNIAYEFDEKYHKYQIKKDKIRQKEIELFLGCEFIRISECFN